MLADVVAGHLDLSFIQFSAVHELRFMGSDGRMAFAATFDAANPWD